MRMRSKLARRLSRLFPAGWPWKTTVEVTLCALLVACCSAVLLFLIHFEQAKIPLYASLADRILEQGTHIVPFVHIFGRGLLAISAFRTAHWRCLLPFLPLAGLLIVWMYHHFSILSLKGMSLVFETGQKKRDQIPLAGNARHLDHPSLRRKCRP